MKIEIISGSARRGSLTRRVALHLYHRLSTIDNLEVGLIDVGDIALPPVEKVWTTPNDAPAQLRAVAERTFNADAYILVTPEYNGSYSPALKNFIDHFPKREDKVIGIVTASPGSLGGIRAAMQLQQLIFGLLSIGAPRMLIVPDVEGKFTESGGLIDHSFDGAVGAFVNGFLWVASAIHAASQRHRQLAA